MVLFGGVTATLEAQRLVQFTTKLLTEVTQYGVCGNPSYGIGASTRHDFDVAGTVFMQENGEMFKLVMLVARVTVDRRLLVRRAQSLIGGRSEVGRQANFSEPVRVY